MKLDKYQELLFETKAKINFWQKLAWSRASEILSLKDELIKLKNDLYYYEALVTQMKCDFRQLDSKNLQLIESNNYLRKECNRLYKDNEEVFFLRNENKKLKKINSKLKKTLAKVRFRLKEKSKLFECAKNLIKFKLDPRFLNDHWRSVYKLVVFYKVPKPERERITTLFNWSMTDQHEIVTENEQTNLRSTRR